MTVETMQRALEHAPQATGNPNIRGWWVPSDGGLLYVCNEHAARIMARGFTLPSAQVVWRDQPEPYGVCCCC